MSDLTNGRGLAADEFDEDEIDWDDEGTADESDGLSPIEEMVSESMDVVVPAEPEDDDA